MNGLVRRRVKLCFHADDLNLQIQFFRRHRNSGDHTAAADAIQIRNVFENFQADRTLPGDDNGVVKRVNKDEIFRRGNFVGERLAITNQFALKDDTGAETLCPNDLRKPGALGHNDGGENTQGLLRRLVHNYWWKSQLRFCYLSGIRISISRTPPVLERTGALQCFQFKKNFGGRCIGKRAREDGGGANDFIPNCSGCGLNAL